MADLFKISGLGGIAEALLGDINDAFKAGFVLEILDSRKDVPLETFVFVVNPTSYELSEPFAVQLTPTDDNTVIAEENGIIVRDILMEGTFGLKERTATGFDATQGGGKPLSGTAHFEALRNMLRKYSKLKKSPVDSAFVSMVFHSLKDDDHFIVIPQTLLSPRDARQNRIHRIYRLQMQAIGETNRGSRLGEDKDELGFWDVVKNVSSALNDGRAAFAEATAKISLLKRRVGNINAILIQAGAVLTAAGNFVRAFKELHIVFPLQLALEATLAVERAADEISEIGSVDPQLIEAEEILRRLEDSLDRITQHGDRFQPQVAELKLALPYEGVMAVTSDDVANKTAGADIGSTVRKTQGFGPENGLNLPAQRGVRQWVVRNGDSIESIATTNGTVPEVIIIANNLNYPYITQGGGPGVAKPGDVILVPVPDAPGSTATNSAPASPGGNQYVTPEDLLYGVDIALDAELLEKEGRLDILIDKAHGSEDADLIRGVKNVIQGIGITLNTEIQTTQHVPEVGIRRGVGVKGTIQHMILTALNLQDGILADDRIESIEEITTQLDGDVLEQVVVPKLIDGTTTKVALPFGKATGEGSTRVR